ncbi:hypothetical protein CM240_1886 [Clostridium bornimense]|uniref:VTC domain-containing protein n=1 Tax=Clostridium bornimense TaxID=1216932 RepID=W6RZK1_9CLOT|nr:polyphosphate polymerase domain-containing protein [Clostridium bornimense]CDM69044.1 hypothetical protein CM240_1886 [Clostridium bornimense]
MKKEPKFRHELKHYITYGDYLVIRQRLNVVAKHDRNANNHGRYKIRSLYFDNDDNKVLREKKDGIRCREKFRIRYYNEDLSFIKLEKKSKVNGLCLKESVRVTKEECEKIISGDIEWMKYIDQKLLNELYSKMQYQRIKPKTIVDYIREPFIYKMGNVRITFDSDIRTGINSTDFFDFDVPMIAHDIAYNNNTIILEVKFDEFLPDIISDVIQTNNREQTSFSKYAVCRNFG